MSTQETLVTDSNVIENTEKTVVENDNVIENTEKTVVENDNVEEKEADRKTPRFEVVFFARYHSCSRPSADEVTAYFNKYGTVHHVNCPENRNYAFVFMATLNTSVDHRRTRTTISQIISEMTADNRFHITVASSNRVGNTRPTQFAQPVQFAQQPIDRAQRYPKYNNNYQNNDAGYEQQYRPYVRNPQRNRVFQPREQNNQGTRSYRIHRQETQQNQ